MILRMRQTAQTEKWIKNWKYIQPPHSHNVYLNIKIEIFLVKASPYEIYLRLSTFMSMTDSNRDYFIYKFKMQIYYLYIYTLSKYSGYQLAQEKWSLRIDTYSGYSFSRWFCIWLNKNIKNANKKKTNWEFWWLFFPILKQGEFAS